MRGEATAVRSLGLTRLPDVVMASKRCGRHKSQGTMACVLCDAMGTCAGICHPGCLTVWLYEGDVRPFLRF